MVQVSNISVSKISGALRFRAPGITRDIATDDRIWNKATEEERKEIIDYYTELFYKSWAMRTIKMNYDEGQEDTLTDRFVEQLVIMLKKKGRIEDYKQQVSMYRLVEKIRNAERKR